MSTKTRGPRPQQAKKASRPQEADAGTSFTLTLDKQTAPADGTSPITANVEYIIDNQYVPNADITLKLHPDGTHAHFSNGGQEIHGTTKADGTLVRPETFTDSVVESGTIEAYPTDNPSLSQSKPVNFVASDTWTVDLNIENDDALANGKEPIIAVATVKKGGVPQQGQTVYFEISESQSAQFNNGTQDTTGVTLVAGNASAPFTDTLAETGNVTASIKLPDHSNPHDTKPFQFTGPSDYSLGLDLTGNPGTAGNGSQITATATLTANEAGLSVGNKPILFELPDSDTAQFTNGEQSITVNTNSSGIATAPFTDSAWEQGTVQATLDVPDKQFTTKQYQFNPPSNLGITVNPLTTLTTDGTATVVEFPYCPADGTSKLTAKGLVWTDPQKKNPWTGGGYVRFVLRGSARFTASSSSQYDAPIQPDGTVTVSFTDDKIEQGLLSSMILVPTGNGPFGTPQSYEFIDPWSGVSALIGTFPPNAFTTTIYANGLNEAALTVSMTLSSTNGVKLTSNNQPDITAVESGTSLIEYSTRGALGGLKGVWAYSMDDNGFSGSAQYSRASTPPAKDNGVTGGVATVTYYITNSDNSVSSSVSIGAAITPTGKIIVKGTGLGTNNIPKGTTAPAPIVYFAQSYNALNPAPTVNTTPAIDYKDVAVIAQEVSHDGEDDNNPSYAAGNYWRRYDYVITNLLDATKNPQQIFKCELQPNVSFTSDYAFGERSNVIYDFKAYFWPNNVSTSDGTPLETKDGYTVQSAGSGKQTVTLSAKNNQLYATMFCAFGNVSVGSSSYTPVTLRLIDAYGNSGLFRLNTDGTAFPSAYADVPNWKPLVYTTDTNPSGGTTTGTNGPLTFTCVSPNPDSVRPWDGDSWISGNAGGPPLLVSAGAYGYSVTPTNSSDTNDQKTYNITETPGTYVKNSGVEAVDPGSSFVVTGSDAYAWRFAPLWAGGALVISNDMQAFWKKIYMEFQSGGSDTFYWLVASTPTQLSTINTPDGLVFLWKMQG
jgi:hypothetical protein